MVVGRHHAHGWCHLQPVASGEAARDGDACTAEQRVIHVAQHERRIQRHRGLPLDPGADSRARGQRRRVVDGQDVEGQRVRIHRLVHAAVRGAAVVAHPELEARVVAAVGVGCWREHQLVRSDVGRGDELPGGDRGARELEAARGRQRQDHRASEGVAVGVGEAEVGGLQGHGRVFGGLHRPIRALGGLVGERQQIDPAQAGRTGAEFRDTAAVEGGLTDPSVEFLHPIHHAAGDIENQAGGSGQAGHDGLHVAAVQVGAADGADAIRRPVDPVELPVDEVDLDVGRIVDTRLGAL